MSSIKLTKNLPSAVVLSEHAWVIAFFALCINLFESAVLVCEGIYGVELRAWVCGCVGVHAYANDVQVSSR